MKKNTVLKNLSYSLFSNVISTLLSIMIVLVLPKIVSVQEYGYWQLYLFYVSYVGIFHLGWVDGIYLRYGGKNIEEIGKVKLKNQILLFTIFENLIMFSVIFLIGIFDISTPKIVIYFSILNIVVMNGKSLIMYILQATNCIKEYAVMVMVDRLVFLFLFLLMLIVREVTITNLLIIDIFCKVLSIIVGVYYLRSIFVKGRRIDKTDIKESIKNINVGIKLLLSYLCSIFIIGIARLNIVSVWGIETFAKVSLTLSISNFLMVLINSIGVVIFPMIKRLKEDLLSKLYNHIRDLLMLSLLILLLGYYPLKFLLQIWLPEYSSSLNYMAILFPMCLYEGKMYLLINTYLKCLRKEKVLMYVNIFSLFLSGILSFISVYILNSLNLAILSILVVIALRCILAELYLLKSLSIASTVDITLEVLLTTIFILTAWFLDTVMGFMIFCVVLAIYFIIKRKNIKSSVIIVKSILKKEV